MAAKHVVWLLCSAAALVALAGLPSCDDRPSRATVPKSQFSRNGLELRGATVASTASLNHSAISRASTELLGASPLQGPAGFPQRGLLFPSGQRHASVSDLQWDLAIAGTPTAASEALQWSLYCITAYTAQPNSSTANNVDGRALYPMPLQWPEKVRQAEAKYYQFVAAAMARGERIDDAAYRAALPRVESLQAVELPPDQAAYRLALLAAADGECGKEWSGKWRDELVKSTKAGGSALGEFLRARHPATLVDTSPDRDAANAAYRSALERALREDDLPALQIWALFTTRVEVDWAARGVDIGSLSNMELAGGRLALQLALCDYAVDCSANGFAARSACVHYGACLGDSLDVRLRNALVRDELPATLLHDLAREIRAALSAGNLERFGLHRRF